MKYRMVTEDELDRMMAFPWRAIVYPALGALLLSQLMRYLGLWW